MSDEPKPENVSAVSPLAELIELKLRQEEELTGTRPSYPKLAARGTDITPGNVWRYATKPIKAVPGLELEKRRGLALALKVHPVVVDEAMAKSLGLLLPPATFDYDYRTDKELNFAEQQEIDRYIEAVKLRRKGDGAGRSKRSG